MIRKCKIRIKYIYIHINQIEILQLRCN